MEKKINDKEEEKDGRNSTDSSEENATGRNQNGEEEEAKNSKSENMSIKSKVSVSFPHREGPNVCDADMI